MVVAWIFLTLSVPFDLDTLLRVTRAFAFLSFQANTLSPGVLLQRSVGEVVLHSWVGGDFCFPRARTETRAKVTGTSHIKILRGTQYEIITELEVSCCVALCLLVLVPPLQHLLLPLPAVFPLLCALQELRRLWRSWAGFSSLLDIIVYHSSDHPSPPRPPDYKIVRPLIYLHFLWLSRFKNNLLYLSFEIPLLIIFFHMYVCIWKYVC